MEICAKEGIPRKGLAPSAIRKLEAHSWPGNVRELYNAIQRAVYGSAGAEVLPIHIEPERSGAVSQPGEDDSSPAGDAGDFRSGKVRAIERFERTYVERLLEMYAGNVTRAAGAAGKDRRAFGRLVKKYGLRSRP
jgi:DNA-binding NtrC family response regulator